MKLTIAVPTYNRPSELELFVNKHYHDLAIREIHLAIFHNEKNPRYSPQDAKYLKNFYNDNNVGILGNYRRMCEYFQDPDEYWLPLPDQDTINLKPLSQLLCLLDKTKFDCLKFSKGSNNINVSTPVISYHSDYLEWLLRVPISEVQFVYRGVPQQARIHHAKPSCFDGKAMWMALPNHSNVLHRACTDNFLGVVTNLEIVTIDELGSVTSGWTLWIPNIIACHVFYMKFNIYSYTILSHQTQSAYYSNLYPLIKGFVVGLVNHMIASVDQKMYCGKRLSRTAVRMIEKYKEIFPAEIYAQIQEFKRINEYGLDELSKDWRLNYAAMINERNIFHSCYPEMIQTPIDL